MLLVVLEAATGGLGLKLLSSQAVAYVSLVNYHLTAVADGPLTALLLQPSSLATAATATAASAAAAAAVLPSASWALRCLESIYGRPGTFVLPATAVATSLEAVVALLQHPLTAAAAAGGRRQGVGGEGLGYGRSSRGGAVGVEVGFYEGFGDAVAVYASACGLLVSLLRQRKQQLRRLMSPVVVACRLLLLLLLQWDQKVRMALLQVTRAQHWNLNSQQRNPATAEEGGGVGVLGREGEVQGVEEGLVRAAEQLSRAYEAVAGAGDLLGRYCHHMVADYIVHMASEPAVSLHALAAAAAVRVESMGSISSSNSSGSGSRRVVVMTEAVAVDADGSGSGSNSRGCSSEVLGVVQRGAYALFGIFAPGEVQHVHRVVGQGPLGQRRREAFSEFRKGYEREFKYSGKV